jgi:hypothetical protein
MPTTKSGKDALANGDGAVGDPASLGIAVMMLGQADTSYADAAIEGISPSNEAMVACYR